MSNRSNGEGLTRRNFVKTTAAAAGLAAAGGFTTLASAAPKRAGGKLNIACVGVGGRGGSHVGATRKENIVAVCDVNSTTVGRAAKSTGAKPFTDYRVMLEKMGKDIDAVTIATPDHCHFPIAMAAMQMGKHVLIEKPLTQTVWEARTLRAAAHKYKVVTQMANQGHATEQIRLGKEWFQAGILGEVREVHASNGGPGPNYFGDPKQFPPTPAPVPADLDWDLWLGPRAVRPFSPAYAPRTWRGWWDFGNGPLGDWGCHTCDLPFWALELNAPVSVKAEVGGVRFDQYIPAWSIVTWEFPARGKMPPVTFTWYDGGKMPPPPPGIDSLKKGGCMYMKGTKATLITGGRPNNSLRLSEPAKYDALRKNQPPKTLPRITGKNHWEEWVHAIKGTGPKPGSNFDYAVPLAQMLLLGTVAQRVPNTKLLWDDKAGKFTNNAEANALLNYTRRKGWQYDLA